MRTIMGLDLFDIVIMLAILCMASGIWIVFGFGWALISLGVMLFGIALFAELPRG